MPTDEVVAVVPMVAVVLEQGSAVAPLEGELVASGLVSPRVMFGNDRFVEPGRAANLSARLSIFRIGDGCKRPTGHVARWDANRSHRGKQRPLDPQLP